MSRRQALGVITVAASASAASLNNRNAGPAKHDVLKQAGGLKASSIQNQYNNENAPPATKLVSKQQSELEFEIFQEEQVKTRVQPLANIDSNQATRLRETIGFNVYLENGAKESRKEDDRNDKKEEDEDNNDPISSQECSNDKENDDEVLEEEGISRLNLAAMIDSKSSASALVSHQSKHHHNLSHSELMMDLSSSTHNDTDSSPMVLDDTIKFASMKSSYLDEEEEEEGVENDDPDVDEHQYDEEDDEETRRKLAIAEKDNMMMNCLEYQEEILAYMRQLETENRPKATYMKKQLDITSSMRSILIDWLVEVCEEYKLNPETLYLAVNYTDRFLSQMSVLRGKLQLVGTASMYIAAKYEEITPPDVNEFVYITDDTYTKKQVLRMEHLLLKVLDFRMSPPTTNWFLSHYLRFIKLNTSLNNTSNSDLYQRINNLARYLAELTLIDADTYLSYMPSQIATSAIYLALFTLGRPWTKQIAEICGYSYDLNELKSCIIDMHKSMQAALSHPQQAIQEKYKQSKYDYVALIEAPKALSPHIYQQQP